MVKGRGPSIFDSGVSLVTSSRSYADDDDDLSFEPLVSASKIKRISNTTNEDYNAIKGQSRRHDAALLNSITNRLTAASRSRPTTTSSPVTTRRVTTTSSPVTTRRVTSRAASEPPRVTPGLSPSADQAVRQAKRSLYRIETELGSGGSSPSYHSGYGGGGGGYGGGYYHGVPAYEETVIRTSVPRTGSVHSVPRRSVPHGGVRVRAGSLPPPSPRGGARRASVRTRLDMDFESDYQPTVIPDARPPPSFSGLRSRATDAKNRLDTHRSMLDRYLPIHMGPEPDVQDEVNFKYGELVERIPRLDPYRPNRDPSSYSSSSIAGVTPYRRASLPPKPHGGYDASVRKPPMMPPISEPRRRAREVLCKTRRDPHYFN